MLATRAPR